MRTLCWFSCGAASAVATKMALARGPAEILYCETGCEHEDNERFLVDCERWFGQEITRLRSSDYTDCWDVWTRERYLAGIKGAPCSREMKFVPRLVYQRPGDLHVFGYSCDTDDMGRASRMRDHFPEIRLAYPLIDGGINKEACLAMVERAGIELPMMYKLGFEHNNCKTCVKATSLSYWALVRKSFPEDFERMVKLSRQLNVRLAGYGDKRMFIDEIPLDQSVGDPMVPSCDFLCYAAELDYGRA